jgi:nitrogen fixation NifU-like protein
MSMAHCQSAAASNTILIAAPEPDTTIAQPCLRATRRFVPPDSGHEYSRSRYIRPPWSGLDNGARLHDTMDDLYRDYILEHYRRPHNFGVIEDADASYEGANPLCGDRITLMLGVKDGIVDRVAFTGRGCAISQASASLLTDEIKGKTVEEVAAIRADDLLDLLGIEISPARLKCAMLSHDSLQHVLGDLGVAAPASTPAAEPRA